MSRQISSISASGRGAIGLDRTTAAAVPVSRAGDEVVRSIAERQLERIPAIADRIFESLSREIEQYSAIGDPRLGEDVRSVSAAGARLWLDMVLTGDPPADEDFEPVREGARRRAMQGFDHHALLRAWRLAVQVMWAELVDDDEARQPAVSQVLLDLAERAMTFSDQVSLVVTQAYLEQSSRVAREHERRRSTLLELILSHPEEVTDRPPELSSRHVVVIAETDDPPIAQLDRVGADLERLAGATLWTVRRQSVVAVIPVARYSTREKLVAVLGTSGLSKRSVARLGVGGEAGDLFETRQSYQEAAEALAFGPKLGSLPGPIFDFFDVGGYALMCADPGRAKRFVAYVLAPLAGFTAPWLEPTLDAYISRQCRLKETATLLGLHPNTVKYRIRCLPVAITQVLNDPSRAAALLAGLRLRRVLGENDV